ncbi:MAG: hypothetical protein K6E95_08055 [Lachnospiraceae bacterium]|nr:hypothetical protein [Lachnospiraceae bacterium]
MTGVAIAETKKTSCSIKPLIGYIIRHTCVIWTVYTLMLILLIPFAYLFEYRSNSYRILYELNTTEVFILLIPVCLLMAIRTFDYLTKENATTFFHSMPFSRTRLFVVNGLTGFSLIIIPLALITLLMIIITPFRAETTGYYLTLFGVLCCECFFAYSFTVLMTVLFCNKTAVYTMPFILLGYVDVMLYIASTVLGRMIGVTDSFYGPSGFLMFLSPIRLLMTPKFTNKSMNITRIGGIDYSFRNLETTIPTELIVGALMLILAFILYKRRKSEVSGETVAFKSCRYIFKWCFSISIGLLMALILGVTSTYGSSNPVKNNIILSVIFVLFSVMAYMIAEMIISRKFNIFKKVRLEIIPIAVFSMILSVLAATDAFGFKSFVPGLEDISRMTVYAEKNISQYETMLYEIRMNESSEYAYRKKLFSELNKSVAQEDYDDEISDTRLIFTYYDDNLRYTIREFYVPEDIMEPYMSYMSSYTVDSRKLDNELQEVSVSYILRDFLRFERY